jgi:hypothetical protein
MCHLWRPGQQLRFPNGLGEALDSTRFLARYILPELGYPVVPAPLVVDLRVRTLVRPLDQSIAHHSLERAVKRTGTESHFPFRAPLYVLDDPISVEFVLGQGEQYVEHRSGQW